jgi:hypothetical protein
VRTGAVGRIYSLRNNALDAKLAGVGEHGGAVLRDVFVVQDAGFVTGKEPSQGVLALQKRAGAQVLAIALDQIECIEDNVLRTRPPAQLVKSR